ncbi:MAG: hypothetical protein H0X46_05800 [Bacteroidetes bacterium]|nr:hypothetical protein [Bacteroidota bacterium]
MLKKIILLIVIVLSISSCSTYNSFSKRKYYTFDRTSSDIVNASDNNVNKKEAALSLVLDSQKSKNNPLPTDDENSTVVKELTKSKKIQSEQLKNEAKSETIILDKNPARSIINNVKNNKSMPVAGEKQPGKLWWIWAIAAFVGLLLALFISAYIGIIIMIVGIVFAIIGLIKYVKSK